MDKRVAEIFQVIELEWILDVSLLLYFSKNISDRALLKELLLHGQSAGILLPYASEATAG